MITKTLTGVALFDERYGGIYRGRPFLACGRANSGKTILALQFIMQGLRQGERCLMLSARPAADLIIYADAMEFSIGDAVNAGNLILLEYQNYVPGRDREENLTLPPEGFEQFKQIIDSNAIQRVVLDTALPWVAIRAPNKLVEHVFSFMRTFERLNTTILLTIPKPVSPMAFRLKNALEQFAPISLMLNYSPATGQRFISVTKYLGEKKLAAETEFTIIPGKGIVPGQAAPRAADAAPVIPAPPAAAEKPAGVPPPPPPPPARPKPSFSSVIPGPLPGEPATSSIVRWLQKKEDPRADAPSPEK